MTYHCTCPEKAERDLKKEQDEGIDIGKLGQKGASV